MRAAKSVVLPLCILDGAGGEFCVYDGDGIWALNFDAVGEESVVFRDALTEGVSIVAGAGAESEEVGSTAQF